MQQQSWLLPDGIVELTGYSAQKLERIRRTLLDLYQSWGYSLIFPPLVEFLDSLIAGAGDELELQTFKVTDQISG
ncbi:MAG TPA: ATP phosphoribosyltransferase regulatory subunit, partial [Gammaproteobacteria bacterium]|nr:ATP phosphoribosyltransferase regulatory subunit [Gammaproteobacteria bacterium]